MSMHHTPKGFRLHIGVFGRRNVGKSSLLNAMTRQRVSIVSDVAGTTTDPVEKPMELLPIGPVLFIDTAGIDDEGRLGELRVARTRQIFDRTDVGIVVVGVSEKNAEGDRLPKLGERSCRSGSGNPPPSDDRIGDSSAEVKFGGKKMATAWGRFEEEILAELQSRKIPAIVVLNKVDLAAPPAELVERLGREKISVVRTICKPADAGDPCGAGVLPARPAGILPASGEDGLASSSGQASGAHNAGETPASHGTALPDHAPGILDLREALIRNAPDDFINAPSILGDLVPPGELAVLVVPIDLEAPKGRLILPQVQTIRDVLDNGSFCVVVKESGLRDALARLTRPPALVVTDSQGFAPVAADTPREIPLTSFSILFARFKGDLSEFVRGACAIDSLRPGDRVLIAESCSHHPIGDDIGRVKIPRWLTQRVGGELAFTCVQGHDFPEDLSPYRLIVHCGACMWNRREMLSRILRCRQAGVPITNYGLAIAASLGIFERALEPFPEAASVAAGMRRNDDAQTRGHRDAERGVS